MNIVELIEIALANSGSRHVEVAALEPVEVTMETVSGLAQIVSELVDNAVAFSEPGNKVRVTGLFEQEDYLISISDRGVGIPEDLIAELNKLLDDPDAAAGPAPRMGISLVARLAARHDINVKLVPGVPGTTARVTVPARLVTASGGEVETAQPESPRLAPRQPFTPLAPETEQVFAASGGVEDMVDPARFERVHRHGSGVVAMSEEARLEAEEFLEKVFGTLVEGPPMTRRPEPKPSNGNNHGGELEPEDMPPAEPEARGSVTALRTRVPGENFSLTKDDPSTIAAERAIDIRSALSKFQEGRRSAKETGEGG